jgi:hypothetical protein
VDISSSASPREVSVSDPRSESGPEQGHGAGDDWSPFPTAEERAVGAELAALDLAEWAADTDAPVEACWVRDSGDADPDEDAGPASGLTDADVLDGLAGPAAAVDLLAIDSLDLDSLTDPVDRLRVVAALDRVVAHASARVHEVLLTVAGAEASGSYLSERHLEVEVAAARRSSHYAAGAAIERARTLHGAFPGFAAALRDGTISPAHTAILVEATRAIADPAVLAAIETRVLPAARRQTPGRFRTTLTAAIAALDPDAPARHRAARETRRVTTRRLADGMGHLGLIHDWTTIAAIETAVRADGRRLAAARRDTDSTTTTDMGTSTGAGPAPTGEASEDSGADACRADALAARILGQVGDDGSITFDRDPARIEVQVVVDLATLRGEADTAALLDGEPVPAAIAREIATTGAATGAWWRRVVTDPVTGHLLDYGTTTYLPGPLRRHVLARDEGCRSPYCTTRHRDRLQLDHVIPFPHGPSDTTNTTTCHQLKTDDLIRLHDPAPDGSLTWRTAWGQSIHVPPTLLPPRPRPAPRTTHPRTRRPATLLRWRPSCSGARER